jgi:fructokinase
VLTPAADVLYDWFGAQSGLVPISYDLNVRPALLADPVEYREAVTRWLRIATVAKASDDDLEFLYPGTDPEVVVRDWLEQFPQLTFGVVTMGSHGALAVERDRPETIRVPTLKVEVVDTVGAGDTFTAGLLHGLYALGLDLRGSLVRAIVAGALVCTRRGAQPPTWLEVDAVVEARAGSILA